MRLCFDATRFGTGLQEAIEIAAQKQIPACEFTFANLDDEFEADAARLSAEEMDFLKSIADAASSNSVQILCLRNANALKVSDEKSVANFKVQIEKLAHVAEQLSCKRIIFYLIAEADDNWVEKVESVLNPVMSSLKDREIRLTLSLSPAEKFHGKSLRAWRPIEPQEWRNLLAGVPDLSLSFSVADCAWQGIDYLKILPALVPAIEHVEAQDVHVNRQIISENGIFGPLWWRYMTVGKGQVDWGQFIEALKLYEYSGDLSIQFNDDYSRESENALLEALESSAKLLAPLVKY